MQILSKAYCVILFSLALYYLMGALACFVVSFLKFRDMISVSTSLYPGVILILISGMMFTVLTLFWKTNKVMLRTWGGSCILLLFALIYGCIYQGVHDYYGDVLLAIPYLVFPVIAKLLIKKPE